MLYIMKNIIVIPVYKNKIDKYEMISLRRCCEVMKNHTICLVTYNKCDCTIYNEIASQFNVILLRENFSEDMFKGLAGYNRLLISKSFYKRFVHYDYMLICQLDAYVFRDELNKWCAKGYDYIGAPWFESYSSHEQGAKLWKVGNGGFSLRKIKTHIKVLSHIGPIFGMQHLWKLTNNRDIIHRCYFVFKSILGWHNTIDYFVNQYKDQEDLFWTQYVQTLGFKMKIPMVEDAIPFAFERSPEYLYVKNEYKLPFGAHAWQKYNFETFWSKFIN